MIKIELDGVSLQYPTSLRGKVDLGSKEDSNIVAGELVESRLGDVSLLALKDVSIRLNEGGRLGIIGSNGSGKTTLLNIMAGILPPTSGRVQVEGRTATMFSMGVGMNMEATGYRNILLSGLVSGASRKQIKSIIPEVEAFTELGDYLHLPMRTYSQGMAMRLKFACVTAFQPDIVLLDEWIGAGDEYFQAKAEARLQHLLERSGIVVLATHNIKLMQRIAEQVLWLEKGRVMAVGPTQEVLDKRGAFRKAAENGEN